jgi:transcriptional regulator with XRE-family HTH domain
MSHDPTQLRRLRQARALSQEILAARCGLSRKTIQRMERGEEVRPDSLSIVALALGVPVTDFTEAPKGRGTATAEQQISLRRMRSGKSVIEQLVKSDIGRIDCDVDATGETIGPLTDLVSALQGLVRERWDRPRPERPALIEGLKLVAALNDDLRRLEAHGVGLYMGHYYRFAALPGDASDAHAADRRQKALVISRAFITRCARERMQAPIDTEWIGAPEGFADAAADTHPSAPAETTVFLYSRPPLRPADPGEDYLDAPFEVLPR